MKGRMANQDVFLFALDHIVEFISEEMRHIILTAMATHRCSNDLLRSIAEVSKKT